MDFRFRYIANEFRYYSLPDSNFAVWEVRSDRRQVENTYAAFVFLVAVVKLLERAGAGTFCGTR